MQRRKMLDSIESCELRKLYGVPGLCFSLLRELEQAGVTEVFIVSSWEDVPDVLPEEEMFVGHPAMGGQPWFLISKLSVNEEVLRQAFLADRNPQGLFHASRHVEGSFGILPSHWREKAQAFLSGAI